MQTLKVSPSFAIFSIAVPYLLILSLFNNSKPISHQFDHVWNQGEKNFLKVKKKKKQIFQCGSVCVCE